MVLKFSFIAFQIGMQTHYYVVQETEDFFYSSLWQQGITLLAVLLNNMSNN